MRAALRALAQMEPSDAIHHAIHAAMNQAIRDDLMIVPTGKPAFKAGVLAAANEGHRNGSEG
jgi:hypothetical protein